MTVHVISGGSGGVVGLEGASNVVKFIKQDLGLTVLVGLQGDFDVAPNGSTASAWGDQSGNGNSPAQGTAANQPTINVSDSTLSGRTTLSFVAANSKFLTLPTFNMPAPPVCIYSVFKVTAWVINKGLWAFGTGDNMGLFTKVSSPTLETFNGGAVSSANNGAAVGTWTRGIQQFLGTTSDYLKLGSTTVSGVNMSSADPPAGFNIGRLTSSAVFSDNDIALLVVMPSNVSAGNLAAIDAFVAATYRNVPAM